MTSIRNPTARGRSTAGNISRALTQRLISALSAQTNYGALYQVDMRLRPSGRSGPVATMIDSFESYQENEAWTWEHMALTRARVVSGAAGVRRARRGGDPRRAVPRDATPRRSPATWSRCARAIATEKGDSERWDLKYVAGGLVDLEFIAQYLQLVHAADEAGNPRHRDRARARQGARGSGVLSRRRMPTCCARPCGSIRT